MEGAIVNQFRKLKKGNFNNDVHKKLLLPKIPCWDEDKLKDDLPAAIEQPRRSEGNEGAPWEYKLDHVVTLN